VETSNVSAMTEMVDLIGTMRQLEGGQKVIQGYSEMLDLAIQTIAEV
jgi:flagellar basal body rod protein FlgG